MTAVIWLFVGMLMLAGSGFALGALAFATTAKAEAVDAVSDESDDEVTP